MSIELPPGGATSFSVPEYSGQTKAGRTEEGPKTSEFINNDQITQLVADVKNKIAGGKKAFIDFAHRQITELQNDTSISPEVAADRKAVLKTMIGDVKNRLTQKKQKQPGGWIRVAWSEWRGTLGKLTELERELTTKPKAKDVPQVQPKETESTKRALSPEAFQAKVSHEEMRILSQVYPNGIPSADEKEPGVRRAAANPFSPTLCHSSSTSAHDIQLGMVQMYAQILYPLSEENEAFASLNKLREGIDGKLFRLRLPDENREPEGKGCIQVIAGQMAADGKYTPSYHYVPIPTGMAPELFLDELKQKFGQPLDEDFRKTISRTASGEQSATEAKVTPPGPSPLQRLKMEQKSVRDMANTLADISSKVSDLSSVKQEDISKTASEISAQIEELQEKVIKDLYSGEKKLDTNWAPAMRDAFSRLVEIKEALAEKQEQIKGRKKTPENQENQENTVNRYNNTFNQRPNFGLCVVDSVRNVEKGLQSDATYLFESVKKGKKMLTDNQNSLFKLQMDYDHPDRITVVGAKVGAEGTCSFSREEVAIKGDKYLFRGKEYTKDNLLEALKTEYRLPADASIRAPIR